MTDVSYVDVPAYIILTVLGLAISFWGRQLARILSSISFAAFLSYITWFYTYRLWSSIALSAILMFIAIIVGFAIGFLIYRFAISILFAYIITSLIIQQRGIVFLLIIIIIALIMYIISNYVLSLLFAATGAIMIYKGITVLGLNELMALTLCIIVFAIGFYNQTRSRF